jgi:putative DNA primase/helicase
MTLAVFDVDGHDVQSIDEWWCFEALKIKDLLEQHPGLYCYRTRGGYRIVGALPEPQLLPREINEARDIWTTQYLEWLAYLRRAFDIEGDTSCADWNRIFRLPHATREDSTSPEQRDAIGDPQTIGIWAPQISDDDRKQAGTLKKAAPKKPYEPPSQSVFGNGIFFEVFTARGQIGEEIEPGKFAIVCPCAREHSTNTDLTSSTALWVPRDGEEFGSIHCMHGGHGHNRFTLRDWLRVIPQSEIDSARTKLRVSLPDPVQAPIVVAQEPKPIPEAKAQVTEKSDNEGEIDDGPILIYEMSDAGNAERFLRDHGRNVRYCAGKRKWYYWTGIRWEPDDIGIARRYALLTVRNMDREIDAADYELRPLLAKHKLRSEALARVKAMVEMAADFEDITIQAKDLDSNLNLFNCINGTIELDTGKLREHRREDLITKVSGVKYDPNAKSELWDNYLMSAVNGDVALRDYLQRAVGYAMQGTSKEKKFFFLYGPPNGGKSTFINAIAAVFGGYYGSSSSETWTVQTQSGGNRGDIVRLAGARLVTAVEFKKSAKFDEALLKRICGGDTMTYAAKYESEIDFVASYTLWFAANDPPAINDDDEGMWKRIARVPFTNCIPDDRKDYRLGEKLASPEVQAAILRWAVEGHMIWMRDRLGTCDAVDASVRAYREDMDRIAGFFADNCTFGTGYRASTTMLRKAYEEWALEQGIKPMSARDMKQRLLNLGCVDVRSSATRYWEGVLLGSEGQARAQPYSPWGDNSHSN